MEEQIRAFLSPGTQRKNHNSIFRNNQSIYSNKVQDSNYSKRSLSRNRKPIFDKNAHYLVGRMVSKTNRSGYESNYGSFQQQKQKVSAIQNICYDYCGCQNQMNPCEIIERSFLKQISVKEMKQQYFNLQKPIQITTMRFKQIRKNLFRLLPVSYPQIFHAHLNNLLAIIGISEITQNQFLCLSWIHYHCKIEYLTYFLYSDLTKSFQNKAKYIQTLQIQLRNKGASIQSIQFQLGQNKSILTKFLNIYFQSVGAVLLPITQYSKILELIATKGTKILIKLMILFMVKKKDKFFKILKFLHFGQIGVLRNYVRQLNWQNFKEQMDSTQQ